MNRDKYNSILLLISRLTLNVSKTSHLLLHVCPWELLVTVHLQLWCPPRPYPLLVTSAGDKHLNLCRQLMRDVSWAIHCSSGQLGESLQHPKHEPELCPSAFYWSVQILLHPAWACHSYSGGMPWKTDGAMAWQENKLNPNCIQLVVWCSPGIKDRRFWSHSNWLAGQVSDILGMHGYQPPLFRTLLCWIPLQTLRRWLCQYIPSVPSWHGPNSFPLHEELPVPLS